MVILYIMILHVVLAFTKFVGTAILFLDIGATKIVLIRLKFSWWGV